MAISPTTAQSILTGAGSAPKATTPTPTSPKPVASNAEVPGTSWYLENKQANHYKFYWVLVTDNGYCIFAWGRIGTAGQAKIQKFPTAADAEAAGEQQYYAKRGRGYEPKEEASKLVVPVHMLEDAARSGKADALMSVRRAAAQDPQFRGQQQTASKHYDDFILAAEKLMSRAASEPAVLLFDDWQALQESWAALDEKHATASTTLGLTGQMIQSALMSS